MDLCCVWIYMFTFFNVIVNGGVTVTFEKVHFHEKLEIRVFSSNEPTLFQTLKQISVQQCINECKRLEVCDFVNFQVRTHVCHMIHCDRPADIQVVPSRGYAYGRRTEWNLEDVDNAKCEFESTTVCDITTCGPPPYQPDAIIFGNMHQTGNRMLYKCIGNLDMDTGSMSVITCQDGGYWSSMNFACTGDATSGSTTITVPCVPRFEDNFIEAVLPDDTPFNYITKRVAETKDDAVTYCEERCGRLVVILDSAKFTFLRDLVATECAHNHHGYWIDGYYDIAEETWKTSTGVHLPTTSEYWEEFGVLDTDKICVGMDGKYDYKLDNQKCTDKLGVICEQL